MNSIQTISSLFLFLLFTSAANAKQAADIKNDNAEKKPSIFNNKCEKIGIPVKAPVSSRKSVASGATFITVRYESSNGKRHNFRCRIK